MLGNENLRFIYGDVFSNLSDFKHTASSPVDVSSVDSSVKNIPIIYSPTHDAVAAMDQIRKISRKVIFLTHNSDINIDGKLYSLLPSNVVKWYAQNVDVRGDKVDSLPIGIENLHWMKIHGINKPQSMDEKVKEPKIYRNLLYMNHSIWTNPKERQSSYDLLKSKSFVTTHQPNKRDFSTYIDNIYNHKFVLCPPGNGLDTHRTWETLYLNSIPIEKRNINNSFYTDLPICFVDSWEEITEEFLSSEFLRISVQKNLRKLFPQYWSTKIINEAQNT